MFSVLSKITEFVWGANDEEYKRGKEGEVVANSTVHHGTAERNVSDCKTTSECGSTLKKALFGRVTQVYDRSGVIDSDVYFSFDVVLGGLKPSVGTDVHAEASRETVTCGWQATQVQIITSEWDANEDSITMETENLIGMITKITGDLGTVNHDIIFPLSCLRYNYHACKGDWVKVYLEKCAGGDAEVKGVMPLRERHFTGTVSGVAPGYGFIDDDVYFTSGACLRNYRPQKGDLVCVTAIESQQGRVNWRATKMERKLNLTQLRFVNVALVFL